MTTAIPLENLEVEVSPALALQVDRTCSSEPGTVGAAINEGIETLVACLRSNDLRPVAPPRVIYHAHDDRTTRMTVAFPVASAPAQLVDAGQVRVGAIDGAHALRFVHHGAYDQIGETYERIADWLRERWPFTRPVDLARYEPIWEEYLGDPSTAAPEQLVTRIYLTLH